MTCPLFIGMAWKVYDRFVAVLTGSVSQMEPLLAGK